MDSEENEMSKKVKQLIPQDNNGVYKNISELMEEIRKGNIDSLIVVYTRRENQSTRTFWTGASRVNLIGTLEQLKFDYLLTDAEYNETTSFSEGLPGDPKDDE